MSWNEPVQGVLPLVPASTASLSEEDFIVTPANEQSFQQIMQWPQWETSFLYLHGESGSGKTHLAHLWATKNKACFFSAKDTSKVSTFCLENAKPCVILEQVEDIPDEKTLFHAINSIQEAGGYGLLTSRPAPAMLSFRLPDLFSRIQAMPVISVDAPDELLLQALLLKQCSDRQLKIPPESLSYLVSRIERSYTAIRVWAERLDQASAEQKRALTIPFLHKLLEHC